MSLYYVGGPGAELDSIAALDEEDPSLGDEGAGSQDRVFRLEAARFDQLFLGAYGLEYISAYFRERGLELRVVSHPKSTNTCFEKADLLGGGWGALRVVKALYFEHAVEGTLYAVVVPETGCFVDRVRVARALKLDVSDLRKAGSLPRNMEFGTCSPFIVPEDLLSAGGKVGKILFDTEAVYTKKGEGALDDFSFGTDHRLSLQMNYFHAYKLLAERYPEVVDDAEILGLSFKESFVRQKGKLKISYEFSSLSYRTAAFLDGIHGHGDVTVVNDHVDELDLPDVLRQQARGRR